MASEIYAVGRGGCSWPTVLLAGLSRPVDVLRPEAPGKAGPRVDLLRDPLRVLDAGAHPVGPVPARDDDSEATALGNDGPLRAERRRYRARNTEMATCKRCWAARVRGRGGDGPSQGAGRGWRRGWGWPDKSRSHEGKARVAALSRPAAPSKPPEGDESDQYDDQPADDAPDEHQDDPNDHDDAAGASLRDPAASLGGCGRALHSVLL